ncbi:adenylate kinase [Leucobacter tenebrionis]|uniref:adenylate kinase n=1 Tax=Leucobacter tenebrionis TaxID=2873270 RepID=UPI001CA7B67D|nr:adenylate kinase [Leucobacter tenebrionis]QZY52769.1 adenylate kinase [Leucobacter tenebrionis]
MTDTQTTRLLIIGPPGAGKGTQASAIAERYGVPAISTGDIFRANIKGGTELGKRVQAIIERGELVPDSLTNEIVEDRLAQPDAAAGFLLDGYPRTVDQVHALDNMLDGSSLDAVVLLEADVDAVVARLLKRAEIEGRADDTEEVIRHRQEVYAEQTAPLIALFSERGILVTVDALGTVEEVAQRIAEGLEAKLAAPVER